MINRLTYKIVNIILAGVFGIIFIYSGFFSQDTKLSLSCYYQKNYGIPCPTCGITRAFNSILKGDFDKAKHLNEYAIKLFIFFSIQFLLRLILLIFLNHIKSLKTLNLIIWSDIILSTLFFIYSIQNIVIGIYKFS